jgi:hypothetical protein
MKSAQILESLINSAATLGEGQNEFGIKASPKGYLIDVKNNKRVNTDAALQIITANLPVQVAPSRLSWDKLNDNTKSFFQQLAEQIQSQTQDHGMHVPARIGRNGIPMKLAECPLLSNLKKAGVIYGFSDPEVKSQKWVQLTEEGRAIWFSLFV